MSEQIMVDGIETGEITLENGLALTREPDQILYTSTRSGVLNRPFDVSRYSLAVQAVRKLNQKYHGRNLYPGRNRFLYDTVELIDVTAVDYVLRRLILIGCVRKDREKITRAIESAYAYQADVADYMAAYARCCRIKTPCRSLPLHIDIPAFQDAEFDMLEDLDLTRPDEDDHIAGALRDRPADQIFCIECRVLISGQDGDLSFSNRTVYLTYTDAEIRAALACQEDHTGDPSIDPDIIEKLGTDDACPFCGLPVSICGPLGYRDILFDNLLRFDANGLRIDKTVRPDHVRPICEACWNAWRPHIPGYARGQEIDVVTYACRMMDARDICYRARTGVIEKTRYQVRFTVPAFSDLYPMFRDLARPVRDAIKTAREHGWAHVKYGLWNDLDARRRYFAHDRAVISEASLLGNLDTAVAMLNGYFGPMVQAMHRVVPVDSFDGYLAGHRTEIGLEAGAALNNREVAVRYHKALREVLDAFPESLVDPEDILDIPVRCFYIVTETDPDGSRKSSARSLEQMAGAAGFYGPWDRV